MSSNQGFNWIRTLLHIGVGLCALSLAFPQRTAAQDAQVTVTVRPAAAAPSAPVPPPSQPVAAAPAGQWVFTSQYGWVYMPYAQAYTYVPAAGLPSMYVFNPTFGWRWISAPWIVGAGPVPYWGPHGYVRFAWYARPWFARPIVAVRRGHHHVWVRY